MSPVVPRPHSNPLPISSDNQINYYCTENLPTEYEAENTQDVVDGDLDGFIEAYLRWNGKT